MDADRLSAALARYRPDDEREQQFVTRMRELLRTPRPFARTSYEPGHFTASTFVVAPDHGSLLLIFHRKLELWLQPGGHIDEGDEDVAAAARRELAEEVGVRDVEPLGSSLFDIDIHAIPARATEPRHQHFDVRFAFRALSSALAPNDEVTEARWVELGELDRITTDESVRRAAAKLARLRPGR